MYHYVKWSHPYLVAFAPEVLWSQKPKPAYTTSSQVLIHWMTAPLLKPPPSPTRLRRASPRPPTFTLATRVSCFWLQCRWTCLVYLTWFWGEEWRWKWIYNFIVHFYETSLILVLVDMVVLFFLSFFPASRLILFCALYGKSSCICMSKSIR